MTSTPITLDSNGYYTTSARGVDYLLRRDTLGRWEVFSQRQALRAARMGGTYRYFQTLEQVEATVRAFAGVSALAADLQAVAS